MESDTVPPKPTESVPSSEEIRNEHPAGLEIKLLYGGAAVTIAGAFLPWYTVLGASVLGIEGDGLLTLILGVAAAGLVWYLDTLKYRLYVGVGLGALVLLIGLYHLTNFSGAGVYITILGGLVFVGSGVNGYRKL